VEFVGKKYGDKEGAWRAWGEEVELYLPKVSEGSKRKKATVRQQDIAEFWESQGIAAAREEEE